MQPSEGGAPGQQSAGDVVLKPSFSAARDARSGHALLFQGYLTGSRADLPWRAARAPFSTLELVGNFISRLCQDVLCVCVCVEIPRRYTVVEKIACGCP